MSISMELIDELRRRTNCSYEEAKILLEKHNGDLLEAIVEFERKNSSRAGNKARQKWNDSEASLGSRIRYYIAQGFKTRFIIEKSGDTIINISVNLLILAAIIFNWFLLGVLVVAFVLGCRFRIRKAKGDVIDLNKMVDNFGSKMKEVTTDSKEWSKTVNEKESGSMNSNNDSDGYNEIIIE